MPEEFIQEACLGRVKVRKARKPIHYLIKWQGYDKVKHITCEPPDNVFVQRVEHPLLDQASSSFATDLAVLLKRYHETCPPQSSTPSTKPEKATKQQIVVEECSEGSGKTPPKRATAPQRRAEPPRKRSKASEDPLRSLLAPGVQKVGDRFSVSETRQFVLLPQHDEKYLAYVSIFAVVRSAKGNPGLVYSHPEHLAASNVKPDAGVPLQGTVDSASKAGGVGWFHHPFSGISVDGGRCGGAPDIPSFAEGDTIGLVIDMLTPYAFLAKNGRTIARVAFARSSCRETGLRFALHLCPGDELEVVEQHRPLFLYDPAKDVTCTEFFD
eukprot:EG_transcript_19954